MASKKKTGRKSIGPRAGKKKKKKKKKKKAAKKAPRKTVPRACGDCGQLGHNARSHKPGGKLA